MVLIGGLIQVISSVAFSAYLESSPAISSAAAAATTSSPLSQLVDGTIEQAFASASIRMNKSDAFGNANQSKSQNGHHTSVASFKADRDNFNNDRSFSNTKILYTPYMANSHSEYSVEKDLSSINNKSPVSASKSKTINSTYKSVTPSITDRVIADLKKEEYLAQQRARAEMGENDEAIYIDGDEEDVNTPNTITEIETSVEKLPDDPILVQTPEEIPPELKIKPNPMNASGKKIPQTIGARDKKSSKKPTILSQKFKDFGFVAISDTDNSEAVDIDDDDYDDYVNSGSGDFSNNQMVEPPNQDWIAPTVERVKPKKLSKQERIIKSFADNTYGIDDSNKIVVDTDAIDVADKDDDQMISRKIAKAHRKQNAMQTNGNTENQKLKPKSKSKQTNRQKPNSNNKRKSKEQRYIDEYFSGAQTENSAESEGTKVQLVKVSTLNLKK